MQRSVLLSLATLMLLVLIATAFTAEAAPRVAMIEVKGMVCSA